MALIASTALAAGLPWLRGLSMTGIERVGLALALGLAVVGQLALGLGLVGRLGPAAIAALVVVVHVAARRDLRDLSVQARRRWNQLGRPARRAGVALGALTVLPIALRALYPPLAFDETLYHLPFARAFAATGRLPFLADLRFPVFPQLVEAVFAAVMSLAGDVATHGVSVVATLATALLVGGWARRAASRGGAAAGGLAAAFVLGQPIGVHLGASANVEPALALFAVAAVYAVHRWRDDGGRGWLVLAGVLAGSAASTKYLGLLIVTGAAIEIAVAGGRRGAVRNELIYGLTAAVAMATSYGRLLYHTGNPVFPFLPAVFGSTAWDFDAYVPDRGWQRGLALVTLPWDLVFDRAAVGGLPPFHPLLPVVLPAMVALACRHRAVRAWMLWTVGYVLLVPVNAHYLWTIVPFVALALGVGCGEGARSPARGPRGDGRRPARARGVGGGVARVRPSGDALRRLPDRSGGTDAGRRRDAGGVPRGPAPAVFRRELSQQPVRRGMYHLCCPRREHGVSRGRPLPGRRQRAGELRAHAAPGRRSDGPAGGVAAARR